MEVPIMELLWKKLPAEVLLRYLGHVQPPHDIIARDEEWESLVRMTSQARPELWFVLGRRRVGKSFLLSRFADVAGGVYFQATRSAASDQIRALGRRLGAHFGDRALAEGAALTSWEALCRYLTARIGTDSFVLVLDEFPYLADASPQLPSVLQKFWDHDWTESRIRLVLCGSYISAMSRLEDADQPLYGRRTGRIHMGPFCAHHVAAFTPDWSPRDRMRLYGTIGSLPGHLALVEPTHTLADTVASLVLDPSGRLVDEAAHLLDAFVPDARLHYAMLEAIANGDRTWKALTSRLGKTGGSILRPLQWLEDMDLVERIVPFTESPRTSKRVVYELSDPYLAFWHRLVAPLVRSGSIGLASPGALWANRIEPRLDDHMGSVFERICHDWVASRRAPFEPMRLGRWWDSRHQYEIDLVAEGVDGTLWVGECKWGTVTMAHLNALRTKVTRLHSAMATTPSTRLLLFTGSGQVDAGVQARADAGDVLVVGPDALA